MPHPFLKKRPDTYETPCMYHNFSVVTSISVVREDDPPEMKEKLEQEYEKYSVENVVATATTPKFEFYLYNDEGDLVRG